MEAGLSTLLCYLILKKIKSYDKLKIVRIKSENSFQIFKKLDVDKIGGPGNADCEIGKDGDCDQ